MVTKMKEKLSKASTTIKTSIIQPRCSKIYTEMCGKVKMKCDAKHEKTKSGKLTSKYRCCKDPKKSSGCFDVRQCYICQNKDSKNKEACLK